MIALISMITRAIIRGAIETHAIATFLPMPSSTAIARLRRCSTELFNSPHNTLLRFFESLKLHTGQSHNLKYRNQRLSQVQKPGFDSCLRKTTDYKSSAPLHQGTVLLSTSCRGYTSRKNDLAAASLYCSFLSTHTLPPKRVISFTNSKSWQNSGTIAEHNQAICLL